ncbi:MAG: PEP-CTERM sorting domain-containing protein [Thermoguttaceae bacterium]|nr:PEP-CTERM sorting domain-containing protein [Thermoguttaceae bacterium]
MKRAFTLGLLVALAVVTGIANAEIIGTDDFDGGKTGWNYRGGTEANWSNASLIQDGKMVVSNTTTYITFNGTEANGKVPTGSTTVKFDYTVTALNTAQWSGVSFFATGSEKYFWGRSGNSQYINIAQANSNVVSNVKVEQGKTYTIIGSRSVSNRASYMWVVEPGAELTYADYRHPSAQVGTGNTFNDLTRVRLGAGTNETISYDNLTVATKASDFFGTVTLDENKPLYSESFSGYKTGSDLVGQNYTSQGGMPAAQWSGDAGKATVSTTGLSYEGYQSAAKTGGMLAMNGQYLYVAPDDVLMDSAGLLGSDGYYGGNDASGTLYIGFLTQSDAYPSWGAAIQLYRGSNSEILGIGKNGGSGTFSIFGSASGGLVDLNTNGATLDDKKTHLVIAKIDYNANADDNITFYFDPDLSKPESEQPAASITTTTGNAAFDTLRIRNGANASVWNVDEIRLGTTWNSLLQSNVNPAESTFKTTPIVSESFSGYTEGAIAGQAYQGTGEAYKGAWKTTNANATIVEGESLEFAGWDSAPGYLKVNGSEATMSLDFDLLQSAKLVDANGNIGGESVQGTVYYGFLLNGHSARSWSGGAELYLDGAEILGLGQFSGASAFSGFAKSPSGRNFDLNSANHEPTAAYEWVDNDDHLIIARIDFNPNSTDILTVYFDPDLTLSEAEQDAALKTVLEGYNLAFDEIRFRNGATWFYDEFRMGLTWDSIVGANNPDVPEPSTWALLILGIIVLFLRKRVRI